MSEKLFNFLSSFGIMLVGVVLLFVGSVSFEMKKYPHFLALPQSQARASDDGYSNNVILPKAKSIIPVLKNNDFFSATTSAAVILVLDDQTSAVLYAKNIDAIRSLASISKLMSALVLSDMALDWTTTTMVSANDVDSSSHHINAGEIYRLDDLLNIALVGSSNSAVNALVRATGLSENDFVTKMNEKAKRLNLRSMRFADPTGLDNRNMSNAEDVAKLLKFALNKDAIRKALQTAEYYAKPVGKATRRVWSTDWLITRWIPSEYKTAQIAGKTGYIEDSDYNFTVRLTDSRGHSIRIVVLGSATNESRFIEARDIADWVFSHYLWPDDAGYSLLTD